MQSFAKTPDDYIWELPEDRKEPIEKLREVIRKHIPEGFEEVMQYGMISYVVPHSLYPPGYHCKPSDALPFVSIASQKNHIALYHMWMYADANLLNWFQDEYPKHSKKKLDMGKSCIKWKKPEDIPHSLISELVEKITLKEWIKIYEKNLKK
jgi:hypothetical protein